MESQDRPIVLQIKNGDPKNFDEVHAANRSTPATHPANASIEQTTIIYRGISSISIKLIHFDRSYYAYIPSWIGNKVEQGQK